MARSIRRNDTDVISFRPIPAHYMQELDYVPTLCSLYPVCVLLLTRYLVSNRAARKQNTSSMFSTVISSLAYLPLPL